MGAGGAAYGGDGSGSSADGGRDPGAGDLIQIRKGGRGCRGKV